MDNRFSAPQRELADISTLVVTGGNKRERTLAAAKALKDPYRFRAEETEVRVSFSGQSSLQSLMQELMLRQLED